VVAHISIIYFLSSFMLENIRFSSTILNGRLYFLEYIIAYMFLNVFFDGRSVPSR